MLENKCVYAWSKQDKLLYGVTLVPFLIGFIGAAYLLSTFSVYLAFIFAALYVIGNVFQAGACVGCPYRGKYCPAIFGVYLGNVVSAVIYKNRDFDQQFNRINARYAEIFIYATFLFPIYWLYEVKWYFPVVYLLFLVGHVVLFMPKMCSKCSYHQVCPGGQTWLKYQHLFQKPR